MVGCFVYTGDMPNRFRYSRLEEALVGIEIPPEIRSNLALVEIPHVSFDGNSYNGQLVLHSTLAGEAQKIFSELFGIGFPIQKMIPVAYYNWDDEASMQDNNTSAFNYRKILATEHLSYHSVGRAIDINPMQNPYYAKNGKVYPVGALYNPVTQGTLTAQSEVVSIFKKYGWTWLGERKENSDYQHFEKVAS